MRPIFLPLLSVDIETIGLLDKKDKKVLEIGLYFEDFGFFKESEMIAQHNLKKCYSLLNLENIKENRSLLDEYCLKLHTDNQLLSDLEKAKELNLKSGESAVIDGREFHVFNTTKEMLTFMNDKMLLYKNMCASERMLTNNPDYYKLSLLGKNLAMFDIPYLEHCGWEFQKIISHRILDLGSMMYSDFGTVPSFMDINKKFKRTMVNHRGLDDAKETVEVLKLILDSKLR